MKDVVYLTPDFAVTAALGPDDFAVAAAMGFRAVLNHRPDREDAGQLDAKDAAALAMRAGLAYRHIPATKYDLFTDEVVGGTAAALEKLDGPILAHCQSGQRSAIAWAAARSRSHPVDEVLAVVRAAGMDFDFLRDEFEMQADHRQWQAAAPAPVKVSA
jgi:sulfide:quinone oxidoreductase